MRTIRKAQISTHSTLPVLPPSTPLPRERDARRRTIIVWIGDTPFEAVVV